MKNLLMGLIVLLFSLPVTAETHDSDDPLIEESTFVVRARLCNSWRRSPGSFDYYCDSIGSWLELAEGQDVRTLQRTIQDLERRVQQLERLLMVKNAP